MKNGKATIKEDGYEVHAGFRIREIKSSAGKRYQVDLGRASGKHVRKSYETLQAARNFAFEKRTEAKNDGIKVLRFTEKQKTDAVQALKILEGHGATLRDAASFYVKHNKAIDQTTGTGALINTYWSYQKERMENNELRPRSYTECIAHLKNFQADHEHLAIDAITANDIDSWLDNTGFASTSRANHRRYISCFFKWCIDQDKLQINPVSKTRKIKKAIHTPEIYTPAQVQKIMSEAVKFSKEEEKKRIRINGELAYQDRTAIVPYLAIGFFAGVRPNELRRLKWENIDLELGEIHVNADASKTSMARIVHIPSNLKQYLASYREAGESLIFPYSKDVLKNWRTKVFKDAGIKTIQDGARHSLATYYLALNTIDDTMQELGHTDSKMLFKHYRGLAKNRKAQAQKYFSISPNKGKIIQYAQAG